MHTEDRERCVSPVVERIHGHHHLRVRLSGSECSQKVGVVREARGGEKAAQGSREDGRVRYSEPRSEQRDAPAGLRNT